MASDGQDSAFKTAALIFTVIASLISFFGILRYSLDSIQTKISHNTSNIATLMVTSRTPEYYEQLQKQLTELQFKVEACDKKE
jgi:hypothetical protein